MGSSWVMGSSVLTSRAGGHGGHEVHWRKKQTCGMHRHVQSVL